MHSYIHIKSVSATVFTSIYNYIYFLPFSLFTLLLFSLLFNIYPSLPLALSHHSMCLFLLFCSLSLHSLYHSLLSPFCLFYIIFCIFPSLFSFSLSHTLHCPYFLSVFLLSISPPLCFSTFPSCLPLVKFSLFFFSQFTPSLYPFSSVTCVLGIGVLGLV